MWIYSTVLLQFAVDARYLGRVFAFEMCAFTVAKGAGAVLGEKTTLKQTVVGPRCEVGARSRLNACVLAAGCRLGEQCTLQATMLAAGASVGANSSLTDCQVGPGAQVPAGTKAKNETFVVEDEMDEEGALDGDGGDDQD